MQKQLTNRKMHVRIIKLRFGEMSERFKEPVLKTGDAAMRRGFESHSLRQFLLYIVFSFGVIPKRPKGLPC